MITNLIQAEELDGHIYVSVDELHKRDEEIERLNNDIKELLKENGNKEKVIKIQNNIIKKIKKYIKKNNYHCKNQVEQEQYDNELLEILDKESK